MLEIIQCRVGITGTFIHAKYYPDRVYRRIIVNYGNLRSRMVGLWFWYNNFYNLPF